MKDFSSTPSLTDVATGVLSQFVEEGPLKAHVSKICERAFNFEIKITSFDARTMMLELFHGPTAAFKDVGARFLAECITQLGDHKLRTVIVATSGDTGGAVAGAFHRKPNIDVVILFPKGMVSEFQEKQLTCWGDNVRAFKVRGTFDDCQRIVKEAMLTPAYAEKNLISANSINIGRILPQTVYYAWSSLNYYQTHAQAPSFVVPTGNLGNGLAALWAKKMGFPVGQVVFACNANGAVVEYVHSGHWKGRTAVTTLANAMDVGAASNIERLRYLYPDHHELQKEVQAFSVSDDEIRATIKKVHQAGGQVLCPHTATAAFVRQNLPGKDWIIVATAHAAKFRSVVEPLIGVPVSPPPELELFDKAQGHFLEIEPTLAGLTQALN